MVVVVTTRERETERAVLLSSAWKNVGNICCCCFCLFVCLFVCFVVFVLLFLFRFVVVIVLCLFIIASILLHKGHSFGTKQGWRGLVPLNIK